MKKAFTKIIWGYLFVLIELNIFIDVLADPVGYYLIYSGVSLFLKDFPIGHRAKTLSFALIFLSLPTMFIHQNINEFNSVSFLSGWSIYMTIVSFINLFLVFYLFKLLMAIVQRHQDERLIMRTSRTFTSYMLVMLFVLCLKSFSINLSGDALLWIIAIIFIASIIIEIVFLLLLLTIRKIRLKPASVNHSSI